MIINKKLICIILCLLAFLLNLYSLYLHFAIDYLSSSGNASLAFLTWFFSLLIFSISIFIFPSEKKRGDNLECLMPIEIIVLIFFFIVAIVLRLYKLTHHGLFLDEWYWLKNAQGILEGMIRTPFGFLADYPSNMPAYMTSFFILLLNNNFLALRLPGVLYSLLNILLIFFFLREAVNKKAAIFSVLLLSTSIWDIHMSQLGFLNINISPFLISGSIFFLYRSLKYLSIKNITITGILLGISINLLYVAAISSILIITYFIIYSIVQFILNRNRKKIIYLFLVLMTTTFMVISPTIAKIYKYQPTSIGRHKDLIFENLNYSKNQGRFVYYIDQIKSVFKDFISHEDIYNMTLWGIILEPAVLFFFLVGFVYSIKYLFHYPFFILLIYLDFFISFIPLVVYYRSSIWREYGFLPTIYIFSAIGMAIIYNIISKVWTLLFTSNKNNYFKYFPLTFIIVLYLILWCGYFNLYHERLLQKNTDIYESYCKKTTDYIDQNVPKNSLILLPKEMCEGFISIILMDKYQYANYENYQDIEQYLKRGKQVVIVRIADSDYSNEFSKNNPMPVFEENLKGFNPLLRKTVIYGDYNDKIYSIIYSS